ncbi:MAG: hypothetical protein ACREJN_10620 [Nitrospiraceae bacterium]
MSQEEVLESIVCKVLGRVGTCTFRELSERLPAYSMNQLFFVVDRLTRDGTVTLLHPAPSRYLFKLAPRRTNSPRYAA